MQIFQSLIPIFAVIGLGIVLRWRGFLTAEVTQGFNRFAYYFALPMFLFYELGSAATGTGLANQFVMILLPAAMLTAVTGWLVATAFRLPMDSRGAMIQASFRGNLAFIGLPLIFFSTDHLPDPLRSQIETAVLISIVPVVLFYNLCSVAILEYYRPQASSQSSVADLFKQVIANPLIVACVAGAAMQMSGLPIPVSISRTCEVVGASAFPMALLGIGSQLASISVVGQWVAASLATVIKAVVCPLFGWLIAMATGLDGVQLQSILILCACPTSVSSYVLTEQMQGDADLAASSVVLCTVCSLFTLSILLCLTG